MADTNLHDIVFLDAEGKERTLAAFDSRAVLVVNVASRCGLTPQYEQLEELQKQYGERGLTVIGFPCNQFLGQEPGSMEQILDFCSTTYGVTFPIMQKTKVNGRNAHELYKSLKTTPDAAGKSGRVEWNFEKFLVTTDGAVARFRPRQRPDDAEIISAIEAALS
ncbi:glutathione peroxidase [Microbacterium sp. YY-01]|uniref:glutathione peroxidase n=1 Tax=Microbacterium sp. YY-01 TaxID=3421634 RepID=UPI003D162970